jgi:hypothetical protein
MGILEEDPRDLNGGVSSEMEFESLVLCAMRWKRLRMFVSFFSKSVSRPMKTHDETSTRSGHKRIRRNDQKEPNAVLRDRDSKKAENIEKSRKITTGRRMAIQKN